MNVSIVCKIKRMYRLGDHVRTNCTTFSQPLLTRSNNVTQPMPASSREMPVKLMPPNSLEMPARPTLCIQVRIHISGDGYVFLMVGLGREARSGDQPRAQERVRLKHTERGTLSKPKIALFLAVLVAWTNHANPGIELGSHVGAVLALCPDSATLYPKGQRSLCADALLLVDAARLLATARHVANIG